MEKFCVVCGTGIDDAHRLFVQEMMRGRRDSFQYTVCDNCGSLQLQNEPADMAAYYSNGYYSTSTNVEALFRPAWKAWLKGRRDAFWMTGKGGLGRFIQQRMPNKAIEMANFRHLQLGPGTRILDVGCGTGMLPYVMYNAGFKRIVGLEPYIKADIHYKNGLLIKKGWLTDYTDEPFDVIMFNHSFEHLSTPDAYLQAANRLLKPGGRLLIRIPTVSSFAFRYYREHWVQLDAPRHAVLYSRKGIELLAGKHGFRLEKMIDEGTAFQFIGSEQYLQDIPLYGDQRSWFEGNASLFSSSQIRDLELRARQLNEAGDGDSIAVTFVKG